MDLGKKIVVVALCMLVVSGAWQTADAADVDVQKSRDVNLKVWNTLFGFKVGDPIFDGDVPAWDRVQVNGSWWATDVAVKQRFLSSFTAYHSIAAIEPAGPTFEMPNLQGWLAAHVAGRVQLDDIKSETEDIYTAIDLAAWVAGASPTHPEGTIIPITGGTSPQLPGYQVGAVEPIFDPAIGWLSPSPYTGPVTVVGDIGLTEAPERGLMCYNVACGQSHYDFGTGAAEVPPIPADFFGPGSDPFAGVVELDGANPSGPDTVLRRLDELILPNPLPATEVVQVELVALSLVSCQPIIVTENGGQNPQQWDVAVDLVAVPPPLVGEMTVTKTHDNGGTFRSEFYVQPQFTFTKVGDPGQVRVLDTALEGLPPSQIIQIDLHTWQDTSAKPNPPCDGNGFYPLGPQPMMMQSAAMMLELQPPGPIRPYIALSTEEQWQRAMARGTVRPYDIAEWPDYMLSWQNPDEGGPYPDNTILPAELSVWPGTEVCGACPGNWDSLPAPGLVMAWGDPCLPNGSYSGAWIYQYPADPDLTNVTMTITVFPPCGMNVVSFGMKDVNGKIRGWYWNVAAAPGPGTLQCNVGTTININTALTGTGAATPVAASYMNDPGFDITQVVELIFDENNAWIAGTGVPPPGMLNPMPWNYWRDLLITPNAQVKPNDPVKWSQPPVEIDQAIFLGWDEVSVDPYQPLMADDWLCEDPRPVTDIHWWGSFINWYDPDPPFLPTAFHIGIWTDVPQNSADPNSLFSHPGEMVWEYTCTNYQWNFAGYDKDPRDDAANPLVHDSTFQFYCDLPDPNWFYQKPLINGQGRVYWLSIAAVYPAGHIAQYPWGWKTRPHFFNDDAVRIFSLQSGVWPPVVGDKYLDGEPVEFPEKISWDLAFELTTNEPEPDEPNPDLNLTGVVDLDDFLIVVRRWLLVWP